MSALFYYSQTYKNYEFPKLIILRITDSIQLLLFPKGNSLYCRVWRQVALYHYLELAYTFEFDGLSGEVVARWYRICENVEKQRFCGWAVHSKNCCIANNWLHYKPFQTVTVHFHFITIKKPATISRLIWKFFEVSKSGKVVNLSEQMND